MKLLWIPCWDDYVGGEAYNIILEKENGDFNKNEVSIDFDFDELTQYTISVENGVLSLRKECLNDYYSNDYVDLVIDGVASKDNLNEISTVLKAFGAKYSNPIKKQEHEKRKNEWLNSSVYEIEIKGW